MKNRIWLLGFLLVACASSQKAPENAYRSAEDNRPLVDDKYSLQADRKALDEARNQVPPDKKRQNDELALIVGMMNETKKSPSDIRSQFDSLLRKKRSLFDKDITKERETFTKEERKNREAFLKTQQAQRETFNHEKHSRDEKNDFFKDLDQKRAEFFSVERDKRADFESDVRERRKSFEDYAREKQDEFNQELRAYTKRYEDFKKQEREKEKSQPQSAQSRFSSPESVNGAANTAGVSNSMSDEAQQLERELDEIRQRSGTSLHSGPSGE
jgi:hypothetical protein